MFERGGFGAVAGLCSRPQVQREPRSQRRGRASPALRLSGLHHGERIESPVAAGERVSPRTNCEHSAYRATCVARYAAARRSAAGAAPPRSCAGRGAVVRARIGRCNDTTSVAMSPTLSATPLNTAIRSWLRRVLRARTMSVATTAINNRMPIFAMANTPKSNSNVVSALNSAATGCRAKTSPNAPQIANAEGARPTRQRSPEGCRQAYRHEQRF